MGHRAHRASIRVAETLGFVVFGACSSSSSSATCVDVNISDYDVSCTSASDCMLIATGELCTSTDCVLCDVNAAVNVSNLPKYNSATAPIYETPMQDDDIPIQDCPCVGTTMAACEGGKCAVVPFGADAG